MPQQQEEDQAEDVKREAEGWQKVEPVDWDNYHFALLPPWGYHAQIMKVLCEMVHLVHSISEKCPSAETGFEPGAHPTANALVVRLDVLTQVGPPSFGWMYFLHCDWDPGSIPGCSKMGFESLR